MSLSRTRRLHGVRGLAVLGLVSLATMVGVQSTAVAATTAPAVAAGGTYANCPYGYVCIYAGASWSGTPLKYYTYGVHKIYGQYGVHRVFNNQSGGAIVRLCTGSNGTGCGAPLGAYQYDDYNLTPINSILLSAH